MILITWPLGTLSNVKKAVGQISHFTLLLPIPNSDGYLADEKLSE